MNRETDVAIDWPAELMTLFNVRMKAHGNGLDRELMRCDRRYALQQLMYAHTLPDVRLHKLAAQLLFYFEERESAHKSLH